MTRLTSTHPSQNPTESEVKKLVVEHRADDRVTFEQFVPIMQVYILHTYHKHKYIDNIDIGFLMTLSYLFRPSARADRLTPAMTSSRVSVTLTRTVTGSSPRRSCGTCSPRSGRSSATRRPSSCWWATRTARATSTTKTSSEPS